MHSFFNSRESKATDIDEICPGLYMSDVFTAENMEILRKFNITHILTLSAGISPRYPDMFDYKVIKIDDSPMQDIKQHFWNAIEFIE